METADPAANRRIAVAITLGCIPLVLAVVLNFLRPDLMRPMLGHVYGYGLMGAELMLIVGGMCIFVVAALQRGWGTRVGVALAGLALCTFPAVLLLLFGPIVFAFMFGNIGG